MHFRPESLGRGSYGDEYRIELLDGYRQALVLESEYIGLDGLFDVCDGLLLGASLGDATGQARTFDDVIAALAGIDDHLAHEALPTSQ